MQTGTASAARALAPIFLTMTALVALAPLSGCGVALEKSRVERRFTSYHGCRAERVINEGGGAYRVEGCGVRAHFVCVDRHDDHPVLGRAMWGNGGCVQDHVAYPDPRVTRQRANEHEGVTVRPRPGGEMSVRAELRAPAGKVLLFGAPEISETRAFFIVDLLASAAAEARVGDAAETLDAERCQARAWADGDRLPFASFDFRQIGRVVRFRGEFDVADVARVAEAERALLLLCGARIELDARERELLAEFHVRFRELQTAEGAEVYLSDAR